MVTDSLGTIRIAHLYPRQMSIYGDTGNIRALAQRALWRGYAVDVIPVDIGPCPDMDSVDLVVIGGGEDRAQRAIAEDLRSLKGPALRSAAEGGLPILAICGGYQLLGAFYRGADGSTLMGIGLLPVETVHAGEAAPRCVGSIVVRWGSETLVGFENHGGRTYLTGGQPLGRVQIGFGNNGSDGSEGCVAGSVIGTYLHGALLPKNPHLADHLLSLAVRRRGLPPLPPLDDTIETIAHRAAVQRAQARKR